MVATPLAAEGDPPASAAAPDAAVVLAVFDLDGTITRHDSLAPLLWGYAWRHPWRLLQLLVALPHLLGALLARDRGELKGTMIHALLGGLPRSAVTAWTNRFCARLLRAGLFAEAVEHIRSHQQAGHRLVLLSASTDFYVPLIGARLGFGSTVCTPVAWRADGRLDGRLAGPNHRGEQKARVLRQLMAETGAREVHAYGNSSADLPHLRLATHGWFVNGNAALIGMDHPNVRVVRWRTPGGI